MVNTAKIEAEVETIAAETTSVISGMLGAFNPRWPRFVETWQGWSIRKKAIAFMVAGVIGGFVWAFGVSTLRLISGSYRSAYAYGHGQNITAADLQTMQENAIATAMAASATRAQFNDLEAKVHQIEIEQNAIEKRLSEPAAKITTGSIAKKALVRKTVRKPASSSWFSLP